MKQMLVIGIVLVTMQWIIACGVMPKGDQGEIGATGVSIKGDRADAQGSVIKDSHGKVIGTFLGFYNGQSTTLDYYLTAEGLIVLLDSTTGVYYSQLSTAYFDNTNCQGGVYTNGYVRLNTVFVYSAQYYKAGSRETSVGIQSHLTNGVCTNSSQTLATAMSLEAINQPYNYAAQAPLILEQ